METERLIDKEALQNQLDVIETRTLFVSGYLSMLKQIGLVPPGFAIEHEIHLDELGKVMDAVLAAKEELGLHTNLKIAEKITFAVSSAVNREQCQGET